MNFRFSHTVLNTVALVLVAGSLAIPRAFSQSDGDDEAFGLPDGVGRDTVMAYCAACHSLRLVSQQRLRRYQWEELLVEMSQKHNMPKLAPEDEKVITDYLAEFLAPPHRKRRF